ncbi:FAD-binding oxidoreductase [Aestuariimicrobium kwangyangense]|uniref:FAD-binding oxidoreductase n=1 Tax=Aestuariimicrobium kwangyangense TaxID=396389 RepID=UPI0003B32C88|nr:FAD-binding oxidoreductase [Aestuariimicrobium kwangyangense]
MLGVKNQKWWGWGDEGKGFTYDNKPKFPGFVMDKLGVDITTMNPVAPDFRDLDVPASQLSDDLRARLVEALGGEKFVVLDDECRVAHAYGKGIRDLVRVRRGELGRVPDAVLYPSDEAQVIALVAAALEANAVVIPYGGGSNIVAALEALPDETRQVLSVDMGRMNKVLEIDEQSGLARIQAGALGPDMEAQLNARGWTMGHFPDSFIWSTVGGWIATRSSGMQSDKYGDIADITRGLRMVMPEGRVLQLRPLPSTSSGPSVREMVIGSEGRLGIITEAWMNVHRKPEVREIQAYFFATYADGLRAAEEICHSDAAPFLVRVSDNNETQFSMSTAKPSGKISHLGSQVIEKLMVRKGWDLGKICLSFIGFEGSATHVRYTKSIVNKIVATHNGMGVGKGPGAMYDQKKYDVPQIRDFLLSTGIPADVSETATPWSKAQTVHDETVKRAEEAFAASGHRGYIMCHVSHSYHGGACQYFTFAVADGSETNLESYDLVKRAVQSSFMEHGGTVSHHHGVGEEHSPWMAEDISEAGVHIQRTLFDGIDPQGNLNPGKIVHDGVPGWSSNSLPEQESKAKLAARRGAKGE